MQQLQPMARVINPGTERLPELVPAPGAEGAGKGLVRGSGMFVGEMWAALCSDASSSGLRVCMCGVVAVPQVPCVGWGNVIN